MTPPKALWRVEYLQGYGFPEVYKREQTKRTYESAEDAGRMVATILGMPSHLQLIGVWRTSTEWEPVDPAGLPVSALPDDQLQEAT